VIDTLMAPMDAPNASACTTPPARCASCWTPPTTTFPQHAVHDEFLHQPKAVLAVAFACVIAFMGIGLVDPILKPIADSLGATPSQTSLLFTSYMAVMGWPC
jgi:hypothetical protein